MATREITQLPDRFTGDLNDIRDRKIATAEEATSASDIVSQCEYLIKNGQTGEFMNVLKSYIDESIRSALGALVANLDKGSSISKILATDSSNDLGTITPANLASVLSAPLGISVKPSDCSIVAFSDLCDYTTAFIVFLTQRRSTIIELCGGYAYGDASINSYYKYAVVFRDNDTADFIQLHKTDGGRVRLGYRWYGENNQYLGIIVYAFRASCFSFVGIGSIGKELSKLDDVPGDAVWL